MGSRTRPVALLAVLVLVSALPVAAQSGSPTVERAIAKGDSSMRSFQTMAAVEAYRRGLESNPDDATLLWKTSLALSNRAEETEGFDGDERLLVESVELARRAVEVAPRSGRAHAVLAVALGRYGRALGHLYRIGKAKEVIDIGRQAHRRAERAVALDPDDFIAHTFLGVFERRLATVNPIVKAVAETFLGGYPDVSVEHSAKYLEKAAALAPEEVTVRYELGKTYLELDREAEARRELEKALSLAPRDQLDRVQQREAREILEGLS